MENSLKAALIDSNNEVYNNVCNYKGYTTLFSTSCRRVINKMMSYRTQRHYSETALQSPEEYAHMLRADDFVHRQYSVKTCLTDPNMV